MKDFPQKRVSRGAQVIPFKVHGLCDHDSEKVQAYEFIHGMTLCSTQDSNRTISLLEIR